MKLEKNGDCLSNLLDYLLSLLVIGFLGPFSFGMYNIALVFIVQIFCLDVG